MEIYPRRIPSPLRQWWKGIVWAAAIGFPISAVFLGILFSTDRPSDELKILLGIPACISLCVLQFFLALLPGAIARTRACVHHKQITVTGYIAFFVSPLIVLVIVWALLDKKLPAGSRLPI